MREHFPSCSQFSEDELDKAFPLTDPKSEKFSNFPDIDRFYGMVRKDTKLTLFKEPEEAAA